MPGLVSTLLNHAYSIPTREVQTFLQVTEQVWHPMHLSRFSTIAICALIFIAPASCLPSIASLDCLSLPPPRQPAGRVSGVSIQSTFAILRSTTNSSRLDPTVP